MYDSNKIVMFKNRLAKVYKHKVKIAKRNHISCWRVYDNDIPEFSFYIELYGDKVYVAEYFHHHGMDEDEHELWLDDCLKAIAEVFNVSGDHIFVRQRKKINHRSQQYERLDEQKQYYTVEEDSLKFQVNLTDYLDTGLFLDHRLTRQMVKAESQGKRVLNLFCYTGSFSVYAAGGGAASVTSVDLSKTYLKWAEDNFLLNHLQDTKKYHFVHADVKQFLKMQRPNSFDLVVMDPPTFSNSKRMNDFLDIQRDHAGMLNDALKILSPNGVIYFSTNLSNFVLDSKNIKASDIKDITKQTTPFDFEGKLKRYCFKITK